MQLCSCALELISGNATRGVRDTGSRAGIVLRGDQTDAPTIRYLRSSRLETVLRPFELATLRLNNMIQILQLGGSGADWRLLVQRGRHIAFD